MQITFCGANREVTGSCYHLQTNSNNQIIIDCGIFQGGKFAEDKNHVPFPFNPESIEAVALTHAHLDHIGRLPKLYKDGFRGKIYATEPTIELAKITLRDAVHLMEDEAQRHNHAPLYTLEEVEAIDSLWAAIPYDKAIKVCPDISLYFANAGHILGSASIQVKADDKTIVFSGDIGNTPVPLLEEYECIREADYIVMESTYGNRVHEPWQRRDQVIHDAIWHTIHNKGVLLIPSFALERTQELLYTLHEFHYEKRIPTLPIFLDSPLAIAATEIFIKNSEYFDHEAQNDMRRGEQLFRFPGLKFTQHSEESKAILRVPGPKIIIAGSGMMNGGRIMHHLKNYLSSPTTTLLIVGYQVEGSLGRKLHQGERFVNIFGTDINVNADVQSCGAFSGHADFPRLLNWIHCFTHQKPRKIFVTHGELNSALSFSQAIEDQLKIASGVPEYGETITL